MSDVSTGLPARWQDGADLVLGVVVALTPLWFASSTGSTWTMIIVGVLVVAGGLVSLWRPEFVYVEWAQMALAFWLFIAPWVADYADLDGVAWTSWIASLLIIAAAVATLPRANAAQASEY